MKIIDKDKLPKKVSDKYEVVNNSLTTVLDDKVKNKMEIEIGDTKQEDFKPQYKMMKWDNEVNFSIRSEEDPTAEVEFVDETVEYRTAKKTLRMTSIGTGEDAAFNFETVLLEAPDSNVLSFSVSTKNIVCYYQPPLTQEEIDDGDLRPDDVSGSYAIYHKEKGVLNDITGYEYKTGKVLHLFRMKAIDANNNWVWCDFNNNLQETSTLEVTIPQDFLDSAVYPVKVM